MSDGFHMAMAVAAALSVLGSAIAWLAIDPQVLEPEPDSPVARLAVDHECAVSGTALRS
jgi:hypothetical protein